MIPDKAPVPIKSIATPLIFPRPMVKYRPISLVLPITMVPTIPPTGRATSGSTVIPAIGRKTRRAMVTMGPESAAPREGRSFSSIALISLSVITEPLYARALASSAVTISAVTAGMMPTAITEVKGW